MADVSPWSSVQAALNSKSDTVLLYIATGAYGIHFALFLIALLSVRHERMPNRSPLRILAIVSFLASSLQMGVLSAKFKLNTSMLVSTLTMAIVSNIALCISALVSDAVLAWRTSVIWGHRRWLMCVTYGWVIVMNAGGILVNLAFVPLLRFFNKLANGLSTPNQDPLRLANASIIWHVAIQVWTWSLFAGNTAMTASIIGRIYFLARRASALGAPQRSFPSIIATRMVIESSLLSWFGLISYGVCLRDRDITSSITTGTRVYGAAIYNLLPMLFGISQSLVIARLGIIRYLEDAATYASAVFT